MRVRLPLLVSAAGLLVLSGCAAGQTAGEPKETAAARPAITVESSADACTVSEREVPAGKVRFTVTNSGDQVTEFYLLGDDRLRVVGEVENIGPQLSRDLVVQLTAGTYYTSCKPGMVGDGIGTAEFTVTPSANQSDLTGDVSARVETANKNYASYVKDQVDQLVAGTSQFATAYITGDDDTARALYAPTRAHWERIEPVAESFGTLDPKLDLREADLEEGQEWTGWHAIEKDLWPADAEPGFQAYDDEKRQRLANKLVTDTGRLRELVQGLDLTLAQQTNGAIGLLNEVAISKVTGEEEIWSHTDLWDFQANIDGAQAVYGGVRDILLDEDPDLAKRLDEKFAALQGLLDEQRVGDGFTMYDELMPAEIKAFSDQVNALAEPLGQLTATLVL